MSGATVQSAPRRGTGVGSHSADPKAATCPPEFPWYRKVAYLHYTAYDAERMVTSRWLSPKMLLGWRCFVLLYLLGCIVAYQVESEVFNFVYFSAFTTLTWTGLVLFNFIAVLHGIYYLRTGRHIDHRYRSLNLIVWGSYVCVAVFPWVVSVVYWSVLSGPLLKTPTTYGIFINVSFHALNLVFSLVELTINRIPLFFTQWPIYLIIALLYLAWAYVQNVIFSPLVGYDFYIYPFLNPKTPFSGVILAGVVIAFIIFHAVTVSLHKIRDRQRKDVAVIVRDRVTGALLTAAETSPKDVAAEEAKANDREAGSVQEAVTPKASESQKPVDTVEIIEQK
ncbi:hypothetical protein BJ742DRAFT_333537 [Cladochytrium replicatum]|nr:hypothetical protein BJ742DRAFT_333537 [Cladochytrium replicatum]